MSAVFTFRDIKNDSRGILGAKNCHLVAFDILAFIRMARKSPYSYHNPLEHYTKVYNVSLRTIQRVAKKNYPLDDFEKCKLLIEGRVGELVGVKQTTEGVEVADIPESELGITQSIKRWQQSEVITHSNYLKALASGDEGLTKYWWNIWKSTSEQLRKIEASSPEIAEANKSAVNINEVEQELNNLFTVLKLDLESFGKKIAIKLEGKNAIDIEDIIAKDISLIINNLYSCKYLGGNNGE